MSYMPTVAEIENAMTHDGGYTKATLAEWGIPWPPPRDWKKKLLREARAIRGEGDTGKVISRPWARVQAGASKRWP